MFLKLINIYLLVFIFIQNGKTQETNFFNVDPSKCIIWGIGLEASIILPVRYIFIQIVDKHGNNLTHSIGENPFEIILTSQKSQMNIYQKLLDRNDGSYLYIFRIIEKYNFLKISITFQKKQVAKSPYLTNEVVYHENCNCPFESINAWLKKMHCNSTYDQIENNFKPFKKIDTKIMVKEVLSKFNKPHQYSLCHYVIKNNKIFHKTYGQHVGFKMFSNEILLSLSRKFYLPDMEFFINLGDWPLVDKKSKLIPIISWCGSKNTYDLILPTYDLTQSTLESLQRVSLDMLSIQGQIKTSWSNRSNKAFWRGRDSRQERLDLVRLSLKYPNIIDARLTNMFFFPKTEDLGEIVSPVSFYDFFKAKFQITLDGTVAAYRLPYLLAGGSLIFKQTSDYYEHFYHKLISYKHYIPIKKDLSDLLEKIDWAKKHDSTAEKIGKNAQKLAWENILPEHIFCYHGTFFKKYASLIISNITVFDGMEQVEQPQSNCDCQNSFSDKQEL